MDKLVRRLLIGELYNIQEYEEYFSEMSRIGLHIQEIGRFFIYFKEGKPQHLNYRIDIVKDDAGKKDKKEGRIAALRTKGWNFICEKDSFLVFSSPEGANLKELYNTPEEQKLAIKEAKEKIFGKRTTVVLSNIVGIMVLLFAFIGLNNSINVKHNFYLNLNNEKGIVSTVFLLMSLFRIDRGRRYLGKLEKILDSNIFLNHQGDYLLMKSRFILRRGLYLLLVLAIVAGGLYKVSQDKTISLGEVENLETIPIVTVEHIEKEPIIPALRGHSRGDDFYYGNVLHQNWSLLMPKYYTLLESAKFMDNDENRISLIADYYLARFDFIAEGLVGDILHREADKNPLSLITVQGEDELNISYGTENEDRIILLCRYGKQVIYLSYSNGTVSMEELLEIVMDKLKENEQLEIQCSQ